MLSQMAAVMSDRQRQVQSKVDMKVIPALWTMPKFVGDAYILQAGPLCMLWWDSMCTSSLKRVIMQYRWWDSHCYIQVSKKITSCVVLHVFDFSSNSCRRKTDTSQSRRNMNPGLRGWSVVGELPSAWHRYKPVQQIWVKWLGPSILDLSTSALLFKVWDLDSIWSCLFWKCGPPCSQR
jgi:hypothetical protein